MPKNLEIKVKISNQKKAVEIAKNISSKYSGVLSQTDTYFNTSGGRLKLREINQTYSELIYYHRDESSYERISNFQIYPTEDPSSLKKILSETFGVKTVIKKERQLYLHNNTRIHIDTVDDLGKFIEFEVPINSSEEDAQKEMQYLIEAFGLKKGNFILGSYSDLLQDKNRLL